MFVGFLSSLFCSSIFFQVIIICVKCIFPLVNPAIHALPYTPLLVDEADDACDDPLLDSAVVDNQQTKQL